MNGVSRPWKELLKRLKISTLCVIVRKVNCVFAEQHASFLNNISEEIIWTLWNEAYICNKNFQKFRFWDRFVFESKANNDELRAVNNRWNSMQWQKSEPERGRKSSAHLKFHAVIRLFRWSGGEESGSKREKKRRD